VFLILTDNDNAIRICGIPHINDKSILNLYDCDFWVTFKRWRHFRTPFKLLYLSSEFPRKALAVSFNMACYKGY
jgi:hypothetical protein